MICGDVICGDVIVEMYMHPDDVFTSQDETIFAANKSGIYVVEILHRSFKRDTSAAQGSQAQGTLKEAGSSQGVEKADTTSGASQATSVRG